MIYKLPNINIYNFNLKRKEMISISVRDVFAKDFHPFNKISIKFAMKFCTKLSTLLLHYV